MSMEGRDANHLGPALAGSMIAPEVVDDGKKEIVDSSVAAGSFKTLAAALKAVDLIDVLESDGPFTVLASSDEAFAKLPEGTVALLMKFEDEEKPVAVLRYHVIPGKAMAADVVNLAGRRSGTPRGARPRFA
jgi:uncharacterized surface protein with fasciclin (FAS1) repeats